jgi:hypothetical protein
MNYFESELSRRRIRCFVSIFSCILLPGCAFAAQQGQLKPRIVVLTDIGPNDVEPDDMESMVRLLVHADQFEIEALIATTGWNNNGGQERIDLIHKA